jgi:hypothetical protein
VVDTKSATTPKYLHVGVVLSHTWMQVEKSKTSSATQVGVGNLTSYMYMYMYNKHIKCACSFHLANLKNYFIEFIDWIVTHLLQAVLLVSR